MRSYSFAYALMLAATGCFNPDLTATNFKCEFGQPDVCPDGQVCSSQGICVSSFDTDLGTSPSTDLASSMMSQAEGCPYVGTSPGQGFLVSATGKPRVYACPTKFKNSPGMTADAQCRAPYKICKNADNIDLNACNTAGNYMSGFFIADVKEYKKYGPGSQTAVSCTDPGGGAMTYVNVMWGGCGRSTGTVALSCSKFATALECSNMGTFQCAARNDIGDAINNDGANGVLCCQ